MPDTTIEQQAAALAEVQKQATLKEAERAKINAAALAAVKYKKFKLRDGKKHTVNGADLKPGDEVELTEAQAQSFRDKFEPVDGSEFKVREAAKPVAPPKTT